MVRCPDKDQIGAAQIVSEIGMCKIGQLVDHLFPLKGLMFNQMKMIRRGFV